MKVNNIYIEINTECNLRCKHCYNQSGAKSEKMDIKDFINIVEFFLRDKDTKLNLAIAGGEPLVHPQINHYLSYLNKLRRNQVDILIVTNGLLAKDILTPYLLQENPFSVQFSLDGASEETNKFIRGPGHFEKVVSYMQFLSQQGYRRGKSRMTINRYNLVDIEPFFELCLKYNIIPSYSFSVRSGRADTNWNDLKVDYADRSKAIELISRLYKVNYERLKCIDKAFDVKWMIIKPATHCPLVGQNTVMNPIIKVNGDVQPCHCLYDDSYSIGNLFLSNPENVFSSNNEQFDAVKHILEKRTIYLKEKTCSNCVINDICSGGCPGRAFDEYGDILQIDPDCTLRIRGYVKNNLKYFLQENVHEQ